MSSNRGIANALAILAETFPTRGITERTVEVWRNVFQSVEDDALERAVVRLCREPGRTFFPSSGEVFAAIALDAPPVNVLNVLHRIEQLGYYDPKRGWVYPTAERIRDELGQAIANAYSVAGGERVFAAEENDGKSITRDIALRKFEEGLNEAQRKAPDRPLLLPARSKALPEIEAPKMREPRKLKPGEPTPLAETVKRVAADIVKDALEHSA